MEERGEPPLGMALVEIAGAGEQVEIPLRRRDEVEPAAFEVDTRLNVPYRADKDADPDRHRLDLYLPKGKKDFPVLVFVHGGAWSTGNKGLYAPLGLVFALRVPSVGPGPDAEARVLAARSR